MIRAWLRKWLGIENTGQFDWPTWWPGADEQRELVPVFIVPNDRYEECSFFQLYPGALLPEDTWRGVKVLWFRRELLARLYEDGKVASEQ